ncbi:hypothetical protein ACQ859_16380 [Roseateles chitinivorans]|uniref:hypothetical protein n=1 Tax=Roseateles chitinivorans TaxID=2917965 RepID=UPI003D666BC4
MRAQAFQVNEELIRHIFSGSACQATLSVRLTDDLNEATAAGMRPARAAIINGDPDLLRFLLVNGAKADQALLEFADLRYPHKPLIHAEIVAAMIATTLDESATDAAGSKPRRRRHSL